MNLLLCPSNKMGWRVAPSTGAERRLWVLAGQEHYAPTSSASLRSAPLEGATPHYCLGKLLRMMLLSVMGLIFLGGCQPCPEKFVSTETLVDEYNANASRVPRLWARARIRVTLSDEKGRSVSWGSTSPLASGNAILLLDKGDNPSEPTDFVLIGREITDLFRVGTDSAGGLYYCWANLGDKGGAWFGRTKYAGAPGVKAIPLDPLQLLEILGVTELPKVRAGAMPAVVMTLQNKPPDDCAYVVRYLKPQPISGHLKIWREVYFRWSNTEQRRPYQIKLYDADGLCRVVAKVADYKPIDTDTDGEGPIMPTDIRITFPAIKNVQTASSLHMRLSEMSTTRRFSKKVFDFQSHLPPGITNPVQVDAECENK